ncbi:RTA1 domain-containing protein [Trichophyton interdigitale]|uniref:RTA1 domain-containing protein n=1 Tax=Trichophyton interdigitale TaxID=101480 RepID=A0A9P4YHA2_9EURO|nr:RTA1 domain-containing protein [Trichophyton interdigitale]KAF3894920.1 RTA1 domain-containing protein [Trichophyton interdigitale]KAG8209534.1 RTA1 domain-containing protein [Trichophyton interdigitale]
MTADGTPVLGSLFVYAPNKVAPVIFAVAYALSAAGHIWQCLQYNSWKLVGLHPLCAVMFTVGYSMREYGSFNYIYTGDMATLIIFILGQVFIYVCPPLLELANYHVLGRVLYYIPHLAPFPPGKVVSTFGLIMLIVETLNALGVALSSNPSADSSQQHLGSSLTIAALSLQFAVILAFLALASILHRRCAKARIRSTYYHLIITMLIALYVSMALILIRCIYRLIEHLGNTDVELGDIEKLKNLSPILRHEYYFYIFEASLMLVNSVLWNIWNPSRFLPSNHLIHVAKDGNVETIADQGKDGRSLLAKAGHILTFGVLFGRKTASQPRDDRATYAMLPGLRSGQN